MEEWIRTTQVLRDVDQRARDQQCAKKPFLYSSSERMKS